MNDQKDMHAAPAGFRIGSIGIVELMRMGDVLTTIPVIQTLQERYPAAELHLIVDDRYAKFMQRVFPSAMLHRALHHARIVSTMKLIKEVRKNKLDLVCSMSPSRTNAVVARSSGARFLAGYLGAKSSMTPYLDSPIVTTRGFKTNPRIKFHKENIAERPRKVLEVLGIGPGPAPGNDHVWSERAGQASASLPYVVILPFTQWRFREWPLERFEALAREIVASSGYEVVFLCSPPEAERLSEFKRRTTEESRIRFVATEDLSDAADLIAGAKLFVGNDSGPLHLASFLRVPIVGLYGPANPVYTAPPQADGTYLYKSAKCEPCRQQTCRRPDHPCMTLIPVGEAAVLVAERLRVPTLMASHG